MDFRLDSGPQPPSWLRNLGNDVAKEITTDESQCPVGCHFFHDRETLTWEVSVFVAATEIVGGSMDGTCYTTSLHLNISRIINLFDEVSQISWQSDSVAEDDELAQHVAFEGTINSHRIWLRVLKESPQGTGPGRLLHSKTGELETLW